MDTETITTNEIKKIPNQNHVQNDRLFLVFCFFFGEKKIEKKRKLNYTQVSIIKFSLLQSHSTYIVMKVKVKGIENWK